MVENQIREERFRRNDPLCVHHKQILIGHSQCQTTWSVIIKQYLVYCWIKQTQVTDSGNRRWQYQPNTHVCRFGNLTRNSSFIDVWCILHCCAQAYYNRDLSEAFVNSSMESCSASCDRADNANGDRISDYTALDHFRHELYRDGSMILVYFVVCLRVWLHKTP